MPVPGAEAVEEAQEAEHSVDEVEPEHEPNCAAAPAGHRLPGARGAGSGNGSAADQVVGIRHKGCHALTRATPTLNPRQH